MAVENCAYLRQEHIRWGGGDAYDRWDKAEDILDRLHVSCTVGRYQGSRQGALFFLRCTCTGVQDVSHSALFVVDRWFFLTRPEGAPSSLPQLIDLLPEDRWNTTPLGYFFATNFLQKLGAGGGQGTQKENDGFVLGIYHRDFSADALSLGVSALTAFAEENMF